MAFFQFKFFQYYYLGVRFFFSPICGNVGVSQALNPELCFLGLPPFGGKKLLGSLGVQMSPITSLQRNRWRNCAWRRIRKRPALSLPLLPAGPWDLQVPSQHSEWTLQAPSTYSLTTLLPTVEYWRWATLMWGGGKSGVGCGALLSDLEVQESLPHRVPLPAQTQEP